MASTRKNNIMTIPTHATASAPHHQHQHQHHRLGRPSAWLAAVGLAFTLLLVGPVGAATAHDELADSSPSADSTVNVAPGEVVLTFANPPSGIGAAIIVSDSSGTIWSEGPTQVVNNTAIQPLRTGAPADTYTAQWRIVSADDHPIEGTYSFTSNTNQAGFVDTAAPSTGEPSDPGDSETQTEDTSVASTQAADPAGASSGLPAFVIYLVMGGVVVAAVLALVTRRLLNKR